MVQKTQVVLLDDLDGGPANETVTFGLDGSSYEIDLTTANAARLRDGLASWIGSARKVGGRNPRAAARGVRRPTTSDAQAIRDWAKENGHMVSERGRISAELKAAYDAAH